jgi:hypothetical protein
MDTISLPDPLDVIRRLTAEQVERRLAEIDGERDALRTILRSVRARERARQRHKPREAAR